MQATTRTAISSIPRGRATGPRARWLLALAVAALPTASPALDLVVDSTADTPDLLAGDGRCDDGTGRCTLRAALEEASASLGHERITFSILGAGVRTITLTEALPDASEHEGVTLDGTTQFGYAGTPLIEIDGSAVAGDCLRVTAGHSNFIALNIHSCGGTALALNAGHLITVTGCFLGTDPSGTMARGNGGHGIQVLNTSDVTIGGIAPEQANVISGNGGDGIFFDGADSYSVTVEGNRIGVDLAGGVGIGNAGAGVRIVEASGIAIGGPPPAVGNIISGNGEAGVVIERSLIALNRVEGNVIGTDLATRIPIPNATGVALFDTSVDVIKNNTIAGNLGSGVVVSGPSTTQITIHGNVIGGSLAVGNGGDGVEVADGADGVELGRTTPTTGNVIAHNRGSGVRATSGDRTSIRGNSILGNAALGIDLGVDAAVTLNDPLDADVGANGLQNFPALTGARSDCTETTIDGRLAAAPDAAHELDFFTSDGCATIGYGQGGTYLGSISIMTDGAGVAAFSTPLPAVVTAGSSITATATRVSAGAGATSEFSACVTASQSCFVCGDSSVDPGEACDAGGSDTPGCDADCSFPRCGDGHRNVAAGEECDDGNTRNGDGCSATCALGDCDQGALTRLVRLRGVRLDLLEAEFSWELDPAAPIYHLNSVSSKSELTDPTRAPGNGASECDVSAPPACVVSSTDDLVFYQVLSACGPSGLDEGPF